MKRFNVTVFSDDIVSSITDLEVLGAYTYLGVNFFDQGVPCSSHSAIEMLSEHFSISETKSEYLIEKLCDLNLDLNFMIYKKKE